MRTKPITTIMIMLFLASMALNVASVQGLVPPSGLVSWWPGNGNANDIIDGNDGTLQHGAAFAPGRSAQAFSLDGVDDYVSIAFNLNYNFAPSGQFTIDAWVNPARIGYWQAIVVKSPSDTRWDWGLYLDGSGRFMSGRHGLHIVTSTTVVTLGNWYHAAVTYNNGVWNLYVNGNLEATASGTYITQSAGGLAIGRKGESIPYADFYGGLVDEIEIFNRALSPQAIQNIYVYGKSLFEIDIKVGSYPNSINLNATGLLPVAILGNEYFDVTQVNPETIELGGVSITTRGKVAKLAYSLEDVNGDGFIDLVAFFSIPELVLTGALTETTTELALTAALYDGTPIEGTDSVRVVPP